MSSTFGFADASQVVRPDGVGNPAYSAPVEAVFPQLLESEPRVSSSLHEQIAEVSAHPVAFTSSDASLVSPVGLPAPEPRSDSSMRRVEASGHDNASSGSLLSNVDRVNIRFHGHSQFSGDFRISGDETVSLPVIGRYDVRGLSLAGFEKLLSEEYRRITGKEVYPTVEVVTYRDVVVTGFVNSSGARPWKRGMTVLQAEAEAGGLYRPVSPGGALSVDTERTKALRAGADVARLLLQQARLTAERDAESSFELPSKAYSVVPKSEAEALATAELSLLKSRNAVYESRKKSLARSRELAEKELSICKTQLEKVQRLRAIRQAKLNNLARLVAKKIVTADRVLTEEAHVIQLEDRLSSLSLTIQRLETGLIEMAREIEVAERTHTSDIETELKKTERELAQFEIEFDGAASTYHSLSGRTSLESVVGNQSADVIYNIVRTVDGVSVTIAADRSTPLIPGDVLVISTQPSAQVATVRGRAS